MFATKMTTRHSRRHALRAAIGAGAAAIASTIPAWPVRASVGDVDPADARNGAGFYRTTVGDAEVTVISDGVLTFEPYPLFGANADRFQVEQALRQAFLPTDRVTIQVNALLLRSGRDVVLVDTGSGDLVGPTAGVALRNLERAGVSRDDVTQVLLTHLHRDHIGGAVGADGKVAFPNAKFIMHRAEHAFWSSSQPDLSSSTAPPSIKQKWVEAAHRFLGAVADRLTLIDGAEASIVPNVTAHLAAGHTPGHLTVDVTSNGQRFVYLADLAHHHAIVLPHPAWHVALDTDPAAAVRTRKERLARYAFDQTLVGGAHLPFPSLGHLVPAETGVAWAPVEWRW
jgi:glyoxylase-like metal-dependent hydrolase (beta-lactamase superfamily II)